MSIPENVRSLLDTADVGVLATTRVDGTVRQSLVYFSADGDCIRVSTLADRAKTRDVERTGRASLCVFGTERPYPSVTLEGAARIRTVDIAAPTAALMAKIAGQDGGGGDAPQVSDEQLAAVGRVILEIDADHVYGASYIAQNGDEAAS